MAGHDTKFGCYSFMDMCRVCCFLVFDERVHLLRVGGSWHPCNNPSCLIRVRTWNSESYYPSMCICLIVLSTCAKYLSEKADSSLSIWLAVWMQLKLNYLMRILDSGWSWIATFAALSWYPYPMIIIEPTGGSSFLAGPIFISILLWGESTINQSWYFSSSISSLHHGIWLLVV